MDQQIQDPLDKNSSFDGMVFMPKDLTGVQAVVADLLAMGEQIVQLREATATARPDKAEAVRKDLLQRESELGGRVFGPLRAGEQRSFFCLDPQTWIWHEIWTAPEPGSQTVRYEISPAGVSKASRATNYQMIAGRELENFYNAVKVYTILARRNIYKQAG